MATIWKVESLDGNTNLLTLDDAGNVVALGDITGGGAGGGGGINEVEIKPDELYLDDSLTGSDFGNVFNMIPTVDFGPSTNGGIWGILKMPDGWDETKDIKFDIAYSLNGVDNTKNIRLTTKVWAIDDAETPSFASPDATLTDDIVSSAANTGKHTTLTLTNTKFSSTIVGTLTTRLFFQMTRDISVGSNYTGTFQLISVRLYPAV